MKKTVSALLSALLACSMLTAVPASAEGDSVYVLNDSGAAVLTDKSAYADYPQRTFVVFRGTDDFSAVPLLLCISDIAAGQYLIAVDQPVINGYTYSFHVYDTAGRGFSGSMMKEIQSTEFIDRVLAVYGEDVTAAQLYDAAAGGLSYDAASVGMQQTLERYIAEHEYAWAVTESEDGALAVRAEDDTQPMQIAERLYLDLGLLQAGIAESLPADLRSTPGDLDGTLEANIADAVMLARYLAEDAAVSLTARGKANAELDGTEGLTADDLKALLDQLARLQ